MPDNYQLQVIVSGSGMIIVSIIAVVLWQQIARVQLRWYWVGAGLWALSVALKVVCALLTNPLVLNSFKGLPHPIYVFLGA